jgi:hypothetical protein
LSGGRTSVRPIDESLQAGWDLDVEECGASLEVAASSFEKRPSMAYTLRCNSGRAMCFVVTEQIAGLGRRKKGDAVLRFTSEGAFAHLNFI